MDFWGAVAIIVIAVAAINAFKEIKVRRGNIKESDLLELQKDISKMKKDIEDVKEYIADLVIKIHDQK
jgi:formyltetrahydrofolate synthetase